MMKRLTKTLVTGIVAMLLALALCAPAFAEAQLNHVTDDARLIPEAERTALEYQAQSISDQYQCGVYIITLDDFTAYAGMDNVEAAAKSLYKEYNLGYGDDKSGILLLLSMAERDYALIAYGYGNTAFTDYGKSALTDAFLDNFANDDWNGGFTDYLDKCASMLKSARNGTPLDVQSDDYITDGASLLTDAQRVALEQEAESISEQYQCGVYIITLDDFTASVDTNDVGAAAKSIYSEYSFGYGADKSGVLLLLSMAERDYALIAYGYGNTAFTDYGKDKLADMFLDNFAEDDWNGGFTDYLDKCASMLKSARDGTPLDVQSDPLIFLVGCLVTVALGCAAAGVVCYVLERGMHSVATGRKADAYISAGSIDITRREDSFTHTTEMRTKISKPTAGTSGGRFGGTTIDSAGFSSKTGKF